MPQGSISKKGPLCPTPNCGSRTTQIWWKDGFGGEIVLFETHCSRCGYQEDGEGQVLSEGQFKIHPERK